MCEFCWGRPMGWGWQEYKRIKELPLEEQVNWFLGASTQASQATTPPQTESLAEWKTGAPRNPLVQLPVDGCSCALCDGARKRPFLREQNAPLVSFSLHRLFRQQKRPVSGSQDSALL